MYDFSFVLDASPADEELEDRLFKAGCDDATPILQRGSLFLSFNREAPSYKDAVLSAYENITASGTGIRCFVPDFLVTPAEIAARSGLTKAAISKYAAPGHDGNFPSPARVLERRNLYDWVEVSCWLVKREQLDLQHYQQAIVSRAVNFGVQAIKLGLTLSVAEHVELELSAA